MHIEYKAGDKLLVDYAGKKLSIKNKKTGKCEEVETFVGILGCSGLVYAEMSKTQQKQDFINSVENNLHFINGVPNAVVTDNLKSAVTKASKYEPELNKDFEEFANYYRMAVLPTRAFSPKDKALVESAVKLVYSRIYAPLRNNL